MFASDFYLRVIQALNLKIGEEDAIKSALAEAEATLVVEDAITNTLSELEEICQKLNAERNSPNSALIKADVLEWSKGERSKGMEQTKRQLQNQLAGLLGISLPRSAYTAGAITIDTNTSYG